MPGVSGVSAIRALPFGDVDNNAPDWWDPNGVGLSCVGGYRAVNTIGTPWGGGPADYAASLVNNVTPGINDLVEGNGAVPWAAATGWDCVAAQNKYLRTGLLPAADQSWSMFVQYANQADVADCLAGIYEAANRAMYVSGKWIGAVLIYANGSSITVGPQLLTGNVGVAGNRGYRNGIAEGAAIGAYGGPFSGGEIVIAARWRQDVGAIDNAVTAKIRAVAIYNAGPAAVQAEAFAINTAMAAL